MKTTTRFLPIIALVIFVSSLAALQSCKKEDKPQTAEQKVDSIMKASATPADTTKQVASGGA